MHFQNVIRPGGRVPNFHIFLLWLKKKKKSKGETKELDNNQTIQVEQTFEHVSDNGAPI